MAASTSEGGMMADTRVQLEVEDWVREKWMKDHFRDEFHRTRIKLTSGGVFDFDAVNRDKSIAASISTSVGKTSSGKHPSGKLMKLRSDMLFLLMAENLTRRFVILTDESMYKTCMKEREGGRVPNGIEFLLAQVPIELEKRLSLARELASKEVTPQTIQQLPDELLIKS
jgi:hypothetical protein